MSIITASSFTSQPAYPTEPSDRYADSLLFLLNAAAGPFNLAQRRYALTASGTVGRLTTRGGTGFSFSSSYYDIGAVQTSFDQGTNAQFTLVALVNVTAAGSYPMIISGNNGGAADITELRLFDNTGRPEFQNRNGGGAFPDLRGANSIVNVGPVCLLATLNRGSVKLWQDGVLLASGSGANDAFNWGTHQWRIGNRAVSGGFQLTASMPMAAILRRGMLDQEAQSISRNPWQLFRPPARRIWVPVAAAGTTVTPDAGALTLAGLAPTVLASATAAPGAGTLTLAGLAPTVTQNAIIVPGVGVLTLSGLAPAVVQNAIVSPGAGALTLTGLAPTVRQDLFVSPGAGTLALTGLAPTIVAAGAIAPDPGSLVLAGLAPAVRQDLFVAPDAGTLSLAGLAPTLLQGAVAAPAAGELVLLGLAPTVTQNFVVAPAAGALAFDGLAPTIPVQSPAVAPDPGSLVLVGLAPTVSVSGGETVLDAKFAARRPNVVMKRLSDLEPKKPLPPDITNMPDAPEPPPAVAGALARGLDLSELPEDAPAPPPEPAPAVEKKQKKAGVAQTAERGGSTPEAVGSTPAPGAIVVAPEPQAAETPSELQTVLQAVASLRTEVSALQGALATAVAVQIDAVLEQLQASRAEVSELRAELAAERKAQALRERNRQRAEEIAQRLLKSD
jgi:hypothetical protein